MDKPVLGLVVLQSRVLTDSGLSQNYLSRRQQFRRLYFVTVQIEKFYASHCPICVSRLIEKFVDSPSLDHHNRLAVVIFDAKRTRLKNISIVRLKDFWHCLSFRVLRV